MPPFFRRGGSERPSIRVLSRQAKQADDPAQGAALYLQAGELALAQRKIRRALSLLRLALERHPVDAPASERLEAVLREQGELRKVYEEQVRRVGAFTEAHVDARTVAAALVRAAETAEALELFDAALSSAERAFELDPSLTDAAETARRLAAKTEQWQRAATILERELLVVSARDQQAELLRELAALKRDREGNLDDAVQLLTRAVKRDPSGVPARRDLALSLAARAGQTGDPDQASTDRYAAADVLCTLVGLVPPNERVACVEAALDIAPEHLEAVTLLEELVPGDMERLLARWTRHVEAFPDGPLSDDLRARLAREHHEAGRRDETIHWLGELARRGDVESGLLLVELHTVGGSPADARSWADELLAHAPDEEAQALLGRIFNLLRAADPEEAYRRARAILEEDPADADALDFCVSADEEAGRWEQLEGLLSEIASRFELSTRRRGRLLAKLARVQEKERGDIAGALVTWRDAETLGDAKSAEEARPERVRLAEAAGEWDELVLLLDEQVDETQDRSERIPVLRKLAAVHTEHRKDPERAAQALLSLLRAGAEADTVLGDLAKALRAAGPGSEVVEAVGSHVGEMTGTSGVGPSRMLGQLYDAWGDAEKAFAAWSRVLEALDSDEEAIERVVTLAVETGRHEHAVHRLSAQVEGAPPPVASAIHRRIAGIAREHLGDFDRAADALSLALETSPQDRGIAEELCAALEQAKRFGEQTVILRLLADSASDRGTRREEMERLVGILEGELGDRREALRVWEQIVADTDDLPVLHRLREEAQRREDPERLEVVLARLTPLVPNEAHRRDLALERAEVLAKRLGRPRPAMGVLLDSVSSDARAHLPTLELLESLCEELGDEAALARALELQVPLVPEESQRLLLRRLADLYEGSLADSASAIGALTRWEAVRTDEIEPRMRIIPHLARSNSWAGLLSRLDRLISLARDDRERWVAVIRKAVDRGPGGQHGATARDRDVAWFLIELAERAKARPQRLSLLLEAAERFEAVGEPAPAFQAAVQVLHIAGPEEENLDRVERLAIDAGAASQLDAVYDGLTARAATHEARRALVLRHARLLTDGADRPSDALDRLLQVSATDPLAIDLVGPMERLAPRCGRLDELLSTYVDRAAMMGRGPEGLFFFLRGVRVSHENRRARDAHRFLVLAVGLAEGSGDLLDQVELSVRELGPDAFRQLEAVYEAAASRPGTAPLRAAELLVRAARRTRAGKGEADAAYALLERALSLAPTEDWVLDAIEVAAVERSLVQLLSDRLEEVIESTMSDAIAAALLRRRGQILQQHLGMPSEAADVFLRLWALRPEDPSVLSLLRLCLIETGRIQELISATERALLHRKDPAQRLQLMRDIAELWEEGAHNDWEALDAWKRVLEHDPDDARAKDAVARLQAK